MYIDPEKSRIIASTQASLKQKIVDGTPSSEVYLEAIAIQLFALNLHLAEIESRLAALDTNGRPSLV